MVTTVDNSKRINLFSDAEPNSYLLNAIHGESFERIVRAIVASDGINIEFPEMPAKGDSTAAYNQRNKRAKKIVEFLIKRNPPTAKRESGTLLSRWDDGVSCDLWELREAINKAKDSSDVELRAKVIASAKSHKGKLFSAYSWSEMPFAERLRKEVDAELDAFIYTNFRERVYVKWRGGGKDTLLNKIKKPIDRVPKNEVGYVYDYQEESDYRYWVNKLLESDGPRMLVISGVAGRGKTSFALQIMQEVLRRNRETAHFFLDCMHNVARAKTLSDLFIQDEDVKGTQLPYDFETDEPLTTSNLIFNKDATPIFVYFDDADRILPDLSVEGSAIRRLLSAFGHETAFRFIFTTRDEGFVPALENYLGFSEDVIQVASHDDKSLEPLKRAHVAWLLVEGKLEPSLRGAWKDNVRLNNALDMLSDGRDTVNPEKTVNPLDLTLFLEIVTGERTNSSKHTNSVDYLIETYQEQSKSLVGLRKMLLEHRLQDMPNDVRRVLLAIAVLSDPSYAFTAQVTEKAVQFVSFLDDNDFNTAMSYLRPGGTHSTVEIAGNEILHYEGNSLRLILDAMRDHIYSQVSVKRLEIDEVNKLKETYTIVWDKLDVGSDWTAILRAVYHYRAARYYDPRLPKENLSDPHAGQEADDSAWHYLRTRQLMDADYLIEMVAADDETNNRYAEAKLLRTFMCAIIAGHEKTTGRGDSQTQVQLWEKYRNSLPIPDSKVLPSNVSLWAKHMAELSFIIYAEGWDINYLSAHNAAHSVVETFDRDSVNSATSNAELQNGTHNNEYAVLLAKMVMASVEFEWPSSKKKRSIEQLTSDIQEALDILKSTNSFANQEILESNGNTLLGILYNRRGNFKLALELYESSANRWLSHLNDPQIKSYINPLDLLRAVSSEARTLMLLGRAGEGIKRLADFFNGYPAYYNNSASENGKRPYDSQDRAYALVNLCQCFLAANQFSELDLMKPKSALSRCYKLPKVPAIHYKEAQRDTNVKRPKALDRYESNGTVTYKPWEKVVYEAWIECYIDAFTGANHFYRQDFQTAEEILQYCADEFWRQEEDRDAEIMEVNVAQCNLFSKIRSDGDKKTIAKALLELLKKAMPVADEPIVRSSVTYTLQRLADELQPEAVKANRVWRKLLKRLLVRQSKQYQDALQVLFRSGEISSHGTSSIVYGEPIEEGFKGMCDMIGNCYGKLIDNKGDSPLPRSSENWLPPIIMRGALLLRPKPLTTIPIT